MLMYMSIKNKPFRDNIQRALKSRKISAIFFDEKGKRNLLIRLAVKRSNGSILTDGKTSVIFLMKKVKISIDKISGQAKQWQYII